MYVRIVVSYVNGCLHFEPFHRSHPLFYHNYQSLPRMICKVYQSASHQQTLMMNLLMQIIGTAIFVFLIAHVTDKRNSYPQYTQPLLIGMAFIMNGTAFGLNCGYPLNPARDLGPRIFSVVAGYGWEAFRFHYSLPHTTNTLTCFALP